MTMITTASRILTSLFLLSFFAGSALAVSQPVIYFDPDVVESNTGDDDHTLLLLDGAVRGLSGYGLIISIEDPDIADITSLNLPEWVGLKSISQINETSYLVQGTDVKYLQDPGSHEIGLIDIGIHAKSPGYATIVATPVVIDDDEKGRYDPHPAVGNIVITGAGPVPIIPMSH